MLRSGKKLTQKQKIRIGQAGFAPKNWLVVKQKKNGEVVIINQAHRQNQSYPASGWITTKRKEQQNEKNKKN